MTTNTQDKTKNTANDEKQSTTEQALTEQLCQYDNVKISTSIDRIGLSLGYLAQCDYAHANTYENLDGDSLFGRANLLEMLGNGVDRFAKTFEHCEKLYNQYKQEHKKVVQDVALQTKQIGKLTTLNEKYQQLQALDSKDTKQAQQLQQQINELNKCLS